MNINDIKLQTKYDQMVGAINTLIAKFDKSCGTCDAHETPDSDCPAIGYLDEPTARQIIECWQPRTKARGNNTCVHGECCFWKLARNEPRFSGINKIVGDEMAPNGACMVGECRQFPCEHYQCLSLIKGCER